jgi:hypothetical protein
MELTILPTTVTAQLPARSKQLSDSVGCSIYSNNYLTTSKPVVDCNHVCSWLISQTKPVATIARRQQSQKQLAIIEDSLKLLTAMQINIEDSTAGTADNTAG